MANFDKSLELLFSLEHKSEYDVLHKNKYENGYTCFGIYQKAHPSWEGWNIVKEIVLEFEDIKQASSILSKNIVLRIWVEDFYKENFWNIANLDSVKSQKIADEIFIFGVNVGMPISVMKAQKLVGTYADGICGNNTLKALNSFDEKIFDIKFDKYEQKYYDSIIKDKPYLKINKKGWYNRSVAV